NPERASDASPASTGAMTAVGGGTAAASAVMAGMRGPPKLRVGPLAWKCCRTLDGAADISCPTDAATMSAASTQTARRGDHPIDLEYPASRARVNPRRALDSDEIAQHRTMLLTMFRHTRYCSHGRPNAKDHGERPAPHPRERGQGHGQGRHADSRRRARRAGPSCQAFG